LGLVAGPVGGVSVKERFSIVRCCRFRVISAVCKCARVHCALGVGAEKYLSALEIVSYAAVLSFGSRVCLAFGDARIQVRNTFPSTCKSKTYIRIFQYFANIRITDQFESIARFTIWYTFWIASSGGS
jgi:hypothetical protein